jgi:hypothetical protein
MLGRKTVLFAIVVVGALPQLAFGSADFDNNLIVDLNDLGIFVLSWLHSTTDLTPENCTIAE